MLFFFLFHLLHIYFLITGRLFVWKISRDYITDSHLENSMRKINTIFKFPEAISYSWTLRHLQGVIQPSSMQAVDMRGQSLLPPLIWQRCLPLLKAEKNAEQVPNSNFASTRVRDVIHHYLLSVSHTQSWKWKNGLRSKRSGSPRKAGCRSCIQGHSLLMEAGKSKGRGRQSRTRWSCARAGLLEGLPDEVRGQRAREPWQGDAQALLLEAILRLGAN